MSATDRWGGTAGNATLREPAGLVFNIQRFSLHDGPGIRTAVFLKGCPLNCWWCHNPESQSFKPALMYFSERCRLCGECVSVCPQHAVTLNDGHISISADCRACGSCVDLCRAGAREIAGHRYTVSEMMREIEKDVIFYDESGGGVTFTGGEPLAQPQFVVSLLQACRKRGIHTTLETCGYVQAAVFAVAAPQADLVLFDLKLMDSDKHREYTGRGNELILANLKALVRSRRAFVVRVPVIPGVNDGEEELQGIAEFLSGAGVRRIDLLPYHQTALPKYRRLHMPYRLPEDLVPPAPTRMEAIAAGFASRGLDSRIGGWSS